MGTVQADALAGHRVASRFVRSADRSTPTTSRAAASTSAALVVTNSRLHRGTILASRKMAYVDLVAAIVMMANAAKGMSALQLARDLHCQHKTAFVLMHKLREALAAETKDTKLHGIVEVDGGYFGGHIRPANLPRIA